jgi:hypothetical protein
MCLNNISRRRQRQLRRDTLEATLLGNSKYKSWPLVNCAHLPIGERRPEAVMTEMQGEKFKSLERMDYDTRKGVVRVYGFDTGKYAPRAYCSNKHNELQALTARALVATIQPKPAVFGDIICSLEDLISWVFEPANFRELLPKMMHVRSVSPETYLLRSNATASVKRILKKTFQKLADEGITENSKLTKSQCYQWTNRSSFVKIESNLYWSEGGHKDKAPRLIQGATPEFICLVGPWIMALQDLLKRRWNEKNILCFTSGMTAEKAAKYFVDGQGLMLEDDLGKFDSSISVPWCKMEVKICKKLRAPRAVLDLMTANIKTHGKTHHGWRYACDGTRKSGDPYTSLFNSVINGFAHLYLYCKWTRKSIQECRRTHCIRMLLQGDDNALRHKELVQFPWREGMAALGFDSEAIYRKRQREVEFCSARIYETKDGPVFGPKPGRVLAKFGYIVNPPVDVTCHSMMRGIALGLQKSCSFIPPIKAVIDRVLELTEGHEAYVNRCAFDYTMLHSRAHESTLDVNYDLSEQYGWQPDHNDRLRRYLQKMQLGDPYPTELPYLLFDRDTSGPKSIFTSSQDAELSPKWRAPMGA